MNQDIEKWINYISNTSGSTRKRKTTDNLMLNDLTRTSIDNLIEIIGNKTKNVFVYLQSIKHSLINTKKSIIIKNVLSENISAFENKNIELLVRASIAMTVHLIDMLLHHRTTHKSFNVIKWLQNYKHTLNSSNKCIKLSNSTQSYVNDLKMSLQFNTDKIDLQKTKHTPIENNNFINDSDVETTDDDSTESCFETSDNIKPIKIISTNFLNQLKQISNSDNYSSTDIVKYFNKMDKTNKTNTITTLTKLNNTGTKIPSIFRVLTSTLTNDTKKNLISKILNVSQSLTENGKTKKWLDDVMQIPFGIHKGIDIDNTLKSKPNKAKYFLNQMKDKMNQAVWGHDNAKKEIIQILAHQIRNPDCKGNVIGLWGPPGNGKTSIIKNGIAVAMGKPFIFISLGGATDASYLEGHSFTYEGSIFGRIAQAIIDAKCMNPVIYFDELDKVSTTPKGEEIINLLIHLIDPIQNQLFRDKYFHDVDIDLSKVTFIFSFNDPSVINYVLKDRISMIETKHLTLEQKVHIGNNYLMKDILKDIGMEPKSITIPDEIMVAIINNYTNEGGVRSLKKNLCSIVRELNVANLTNTKIGDIIINFPLILNKTLYDIHYYGKSPFNPMVIHKQDGVGMVNGLWANSLGVGGVLPIETVLIPTNEMMGVKATGSLGNVIKESIDVAMSVAWNWLDESLKNKWMTKWKKRPERFHVHCPDGSTEKEGPSAGTAMSLAFYSRLINQKIKHDIAMTGEMNLRGEVTEIGGLEEKLNAAKRAGAKLVLIPFENEMDLIEINKRYPQLIDTNFQIKCVKSFDEVIQLCLV